jgi:dTDP-4-dehydrorhamnose reductase
MRVAVSGAGGRLGRALLDALTDARGPNPIVPIAWDVPDHDLDDPESPHRLVHRDRPDVVVHTAAWTDVDGCAREPALALRRNGAAAGELAEACVQAGVDLVHVSTNEVFDGMRTDGRGYVPQDDSSPINPYGASKRAGEIAARAAFVEGDGIVDVPGDAAGAGSPQLAIVRTAWLFGPPGNDFPAKILAAADRALAAGEPLRVVGDEIGSPTYTKDLAILIAEMIRTDQYGIYHASNEGTCSWNEFAKAIFDYRGLEVKVNSIPTSDYPTRAKRPMSSIMSKDKLEQNGFKRLPDWKDALQRYLSQN